MSEQGVRSIGAHPGSVLSPCKDSREVAHQVSEYCPTGQPNNRGSLLAEKRKVSLRGTPQSSGSKY